MTPPRAGDKAGPLRLNGIVVLADVGDSRKCDKLKKELKLFDGKVLTAGSTDSTSYSRVQCVVSDNARCADIAAHYEPVRHALAVRRAAKGNDLANMGNGRAARMVHMHRNSMQGSGDVNGNTVRRSGRLSAGGGASPVKKAGGDRLPTIPRHISKLLDEAKPSMCLKKALHERMRLLTYDKFMQCVKAARMRRVSDGAGGNAKANRSPTNPNKENAVHGSPVKKRQRKSADRPSHKPPDAPKCDAPVERARRLCEPFVSLVHENGAYRPFYREKVDVQKTMTIYLASDKLHQRSLFHKPTPGRDASPKKSPAKAKPRGACRSPRKRQHSGSGMDAFSPPPHKAGYCEICQTSVPDISAHLSSTSHKKRIGSPSLWSEVDKYLVTRHPDFTGVGVRHDISDEFRTRTLRGSQSNEAASLRSAPSSTATRRSVDQTGTSTTGGETVTRRGHGRAQSPHKAAGGGHADWGSDSSGWGEQSDDDTDPNGEETASSSRSFRQVAVEYRRKLRKRKACHT